MKVHFAALEKMWAAAILCDVAGVRYTLWTAFPFIAEKHGINAGQWRHSIEAVNHLQAVSKHCIMDSGLYTLLFGAYAGKRDAAFLESWLEHMVEFVQQIEFNGTVVELDCQKILSVNHAWEYRRRLRDALPNNDQINVFHPEDGRTGLDRLIEFSDYLAFSVPEMRKMRIPKLPQYVQRLTSYAMNKKPGLKVHLLGCTDARIMQHCKYCYSSDSTSWQQVGRYGHGAILVDGKMQKYTSAQYDAMIANVAPRVHEALQRHGCKIGKNHDYHSRMTAASIELLKWYTLKAGSQE